MERAPGAELFGEPGHGDRRERGGDNNNVD
jgi:hypothetical protein